MKTTTKARAKLTLTRETVSALTVRSAVRTGNVFPTFGCSVAHNCTHTPPKPPRP